MPDENPTAPAAQQPAGTPAPAATPAPAPSAPSPPATQSAPAPAPAATPATVSAEQQPQAPDPTWLNSRLEQAKRSARDAVLKELGVADAAAAKAILEAAKAAEEAQKTELQKAREKAAALESVAQRATVLEQTIKSRADLELASLTEAQRAAVAAVAGDDSARVLATIDALKPTWTSAAPVAEQQPAAPAPAVPTAPVPPASTAPAPTAPPGTGPTSPPDRKAEYLALKQKNPVQAAAYLNRYASEIYPRS